MAEIVPAILVDDFGSLREEIAQVANLVKTIQIDVCDGKFTPRASWPMNPDDKASIESIINEEEGLPFWDRIDFEFDLMIYNATEHFEFFSRLGAKRIVFHLEAENDSEKFVEFLEGIDMYSRESIEIGVAINTDTDINKLERIIGNVDFVQCMGIKNIGKQGEPFDERVINNIRQLRAKYQELIISVDGSVNENTAPMLVEAGADRLVVGSALWRSFDIRETIKYFENL